MNKSNAEEEKDFTIITENVNINDNKKEIKFSKRNINSLVSISVDSDEFEKKVNQGLIPSDIGQFGLKYIKNTLKVLKKLDTEGASKEDWDTWRKSMDQEQDIEKLISLVD